MRQLVKNKNSPKSMFATCCTWFWVLHDHGILGPALSPAWKITENQERVGSGFAGGKEYGFLVLDFAVEYYELPSFSFGLY
jgi:hypothetical protein